MEIAAAYDKAGADEVVFLDITASSDAERRPWWIWCAKWQKSVFIPFTVGGGIRTVEDFQALLREGADKVSINSSAIIRSAIDPATRRRSLAASAWSLRSMQREERTEAAGISIKTAAALMCGIDAVAWAKKAEKLGAGEILLTSMDCDGTKAGYDIELTRTIAESVGIPVIASGGAGTLEHFYDALTEGKADAALAASLFHYKELEIREVKEYLAGRNVPVRL